MQIKSSDVFAAPLELPSSLPLSFQRIFETRIPSLEIESRLTRTCSRLGSETKLPVRVGKPISKLLPVVASNDAPASERSIRDSSGRATSTLPLTGCVRLHADCVPVRGSARSAVYDLTRREIHSFPSVYLSILDHLSRTSVTDILAGANPSQTDGIHAFLAYLVEHELVDSGVLPCSGDSTGGQFPAIDSAWDVPAVIDNAIIDVDATAHDFPAIFAELNELGCRHIEIRSFSNLLSIAALEEVLGLAARHDFESLELVLRYDMDAGYRRYAQLLVDHPLVVAMQVHSSPQDCVVAADFGTGELTHPIEKAVTFRQIAVTSERDCGVITRGTLNAPTPRTVAEALEYNGCLNRKIAIDRAGEIRNCPSCSTGFGRVAQHRLRDVVTGLGFRRVWSLKKDQIDTCRICELRYACSDCRANVAEPGNELSKPARCGYDPTRGEWAHVPQATPEGVPRDM